MLFFCENLDDIEVDKEVELVYCNTNLYGFYAYKYSSATKKELNDKDFPVINKLNDTELKLQFRTNLKL